jgi:predicted amidohydrolase YtcJ
VPKIFAPYLAVGPQGKPVVVGDPSLEFGSYKGRLKLGGVKFVLDGSGQGRTAYWTKPLLTGGPDGEKDWVGEPTFPRDVVAGLYKKLAEKNIQVWSHANGDAAIDIAIEAAEGAGVKAGDDRRHVVVHSQFMRPDQLDKYVQLGLTASFFTVHTFFWGDVHLANLGQERAFFLSPMKSAQTKGIPFSNHNDFSVTPLDPMMMIWSAVQRRSKSGVIIGPDERVDVLTAIKSLTVVPAWHYREEHSKGSIEVGKLADLVILDKNPLTVPVDDIPGIKVVETLKEGRTIYTASQKAGVNFHGNLHGLGPRRQARGPGVFFADEAGAPAVGCACCDGKLAGPSLDRARVSMEAFVDSPLFG